LLKSRLEREVGEEERFAGELCGDGGTHSAALCG